MTSFHSFALVIAQFGKGLTGQAFDFEAIYEALKNANCSNPLAAFTARQSLLRPPV